MVVLGGWDGGYLHSGGRYALGHATDHDGDGLSECDGDCHDAHPDVYPGAAQLCDGFNNDCDDATWPIVPPDELDADGDGMRVCQGDCDDNKPHCTTDCTDGDGDEYCIPQDCDDGEPSTRPGAPEPCDFVDNDCDGTIDEGHDQDQDGFTSCGGDCNDQHPAVYPGATELRDCRDNDCDGTLDEGLPDPHVDWDGDGVSVCDGDCDDDEERRYPGNLETCDGIDNDCDGSVDEGHDRDEDGLATCFDNCPYDYNPDQENEDEDPSGDACDCALGDPTIWSYAVIWLVWIDDITLDWQATDPGGETAPTYDLLHSPDASDFGATQATCLESDTSATSSLHQDVPDPGGSFYYLVRGQNDCGDSLGRDSSGAQRTGRDCP
jgi:hypothetical protein